MQTKFFENFYIALENYILLQNGMESFANICIFGYPDLKNDHSHIFQKQWKLCEWRYLTLNIQYITNTASCIGRFSPKSPFENKKFQSNWCLLVNERANELTVLDRHEEAINANEGKHSLYFWRISTFVWTTSYLKRNPRVWLEDNHIVKKKLLGLTQLKKFKTGHTHVQAGKNNENSNQDTTKEKIFNYECSNLESENWAIKNARPHLTSTPVTYFNDADCIHCKTCWLLISLYKSPENNNCGRAITT